MFGGLNKGLYNATKGLEPIRKSSLKKSGDNSWRLRLNLDLW